MKNRIASIKFKVYSLVLVLVCFLCLGCEHKEKHLVFSTYAACACGENEPQFTIKSIDGNGSTLLSDELLVHFKNSKQDLEFYGEIGECAICYGCYFTGNLTFNKGKNYYIMEVETYEVKLRPGCCNQ